MSICLKGIRKRLFALLLGKELNENKKREEDYSVQNCIDIVDTIEELTDEQKTDCNELFQSEMNRQIFVGTKNPKVRLIWLKKKKFSGISNVLITSSAYLENVFLFTLNKIAELLFLFVQGSRPSFS